MFPDAAHSDFLQNHVLVGGGGGSRHLHPSITCHVHGSLIEIKAAVLFSAFQLLSIERCTIFVQSTTEIFSVDKITIRVCACEIEITTATGISVGCKGFEHVWYLDLGICKVQSQCSKQLKRARVSASRLSFNVGF